jgi:glycyl-tRNA synthetase beta chain
VIGSAVKLYGDRLTKKEDLKQRLFKFLQERVSFELGVKPGTRSFEILQAVMRTSFENIAEVFKRYEALNGMDEKALVRAAKVVQRTANMLKGYGKTPGEPKQELLAEDQEKKLYELIRTGSKGVEEPLAKGEYEKATRVFADTFLKPINDFFDLVLVNAEDAALRENRMALVSRINRLYTSGIADLSALSRIDEE